VHSSRDHVTDPDEEGLYDPKQREHLGIVRMQQIEQAWLGADMGDG